VQLLRSFSRSLINGESDLSTYFRAVPELNAYDAKQFVAEESKALQNVSTTTLNNGLKVISTVRIFDCGIYI
jgi:hypothetical protein